METIKLTWTELKDPENGGDPETGYIVFWGEGTPGAEWQILIKFTEPVFDVSTKDVGVSLNPLNTYKFKV
jgi:hypothetical protein